MLKYQPVLPGGRRYATLVPTTLVPPHGLWLHQPILALALMLAGGEASVWAAHLVGFRV